MDNPVLILTPPAPDIAKAHVRAHTRTVRGKTVYVRDYDDKRTQAQPRASVGGNVKAADAESLIRKKYGVLKGEPEVTYFMYPNGELSGHLPILSSHMDTLEELIPGATHKFNDILRDAKLVRAGVADWGDSREFVVQFFANPTPEQLDSIQSILKDYGFEHFTWEFGNTYTDEANGDTMRTLRQAAAKYDQITGATRKGIAALILSGAHAIAKAVKAPFHLVGGTGSSHKGSKHVGGKRLIVKQELRTVNGTPHVVHIQYEVEGDKPPRELGQVNAIPIPKNAQVVERPTGGRGSRPGVVYYTTGARMPSNVVAYWHDPKTGKRNAHYTDKFIEQQAKIKFQRTCSLAEQIVAITEFTKRMMHAPFGTRDAGLGTMLFLIDRETFRVGNEKSANELEHFGITTLQKKHVVDNGRELKLRFVGKHGVPWERTVHDRRARAVIRNLMANAPGERLWQYYTSGGAWKPITPEAIRGALKAFDVLPKDFRTYHASRLVFLNLHVLCKEAGGVPDTQRGRQAILNNAFKETAHLLGHKWTQTRDNYAAPEVWAHFVDEAKLPRKSRYVPEGLAAGLAQMTKSLTDDGLLPGEAEFIAWLRERQVQLVSKRP